VVDELPEFANTECFPGAQVLITSFDDPDLSQLNLDQRAYCVIVTREHAADQVFLRRLAELDVAYLGMIGSRRKVASAFGALRDDGVPEEALTRIHAPIGLDIGARSPSEIAVSILAQMIAVRYRAGAPEA
jgi:xanthine dehydrogenase accessory factor